MKTALALAAALLVTACGSDDATTAADPAVDPGGDPSPTAVPAAPGSVITRTVATVMDTGGPELCLGAVAESYPPQCGGPPIAGWDWSDHKGRYETEMGVRWGEFVVIGTWDGSTLTFESAVPGPQYGSEPEALPAPPDPSVELTRKELGDIATEVGSDLPGAQGAYPQDGYVLVDVIYDDGSLQDRVDRSYGEGVVVVAPLLLDFEE